MHIRNRISDIKKIRCNACQDYLKMVAVEDWKNQLYEKTQIAVKYSPAKYKPAYKIMRTRGIENYEIDDMDVTFTRAPSSDPFRASCSGPSHSSPSPSAT